MRQNAGCATGRRGQWQGLAQAVFVRPRHHQHLTIPGVLCDGRNQTVGVERDGGHQGVDAFFGRPWGSDLLQVYGLIDVRDQVVRIFSVEDKAFADARARQACARPAGEAGRQL